MYTSDWEKFLQKYNSASIEEKTLIDGEKIPDFIEASIKKYGLSISSQKTLTSLIPDLILKIIGMRVAEEVIRSEFKLENDAVTELSTEIKQFIERDKPHLINIAEQGSVIQEPSTQEAPPLEKVSPFRTMEGDARKIHGYGAFRGADPVEEDQPVYRSEQAKLVPPPTYSDDSSTPNK